MASPVFRSDVVVLLLMTQRLLLISLFRFCVGSVISSFYIVLFLNDLDWEESAGCFTSIVFLVVCVC